MLVELNNLRRKHHELPREYQLTEVIPLLHISQIYISQLLTVLQNRAQEKRQ